LFAEPLDRHPQREVLGVFFTQLRPRKVKRLAVEESQQLDGRIPAPEVAFQGV